MTQISIYLSLHKLQTHDPFLPIGQHHPSQNISGLFIFIISLLSANIVFKFLIAGNVRPDNIVRSQ